MYADSITKSMGVTIDITNRRREIQNKYNIEHGITPKSIVKDIRDVIANTIAAEDKKSFEVDDDISIDELNSMIEALKMEMYKCAEELNFERAAEIRDKISQLQKMVID